MKNEAIDVYALPRCAMVATSNVAGTLGVTPATLKAMVRDGRLPAPRRLSPRYFAWPAGEIQDFLTNLPQ